MFTARHHFRRFRSLSFLALGLALLAFALSSGAPARVATATTANGADFASQELGNAWDMTGPADIAFEHTRDNGNGNQGIGHPFSDLSFSGGLLSATATGDDPRITLMIPSDPGVNPVPPEGGYRPIDASKYKYLTVRLNVPTTTY